MLRQRIQLVSSLMGGGVVWLLRVVGVPSRTCAEGEFVKPVELPNGRFPIEVAGGNVLPYSDGVAGFGWSGDVGVIMTSAIGPTGKSPRYPTGKVRIPAPECGSGAGLTSNVEFS
uniref:(northern house mosquito) hypothetical protein n=1 Tax=Culex pipiens TaxID=7175 RepID=A0A8D8II48_CULPI